MSARVSFRGGVTCSCVAESLPVVEEYMLLTGLISDRIDIYQLGYRGDVSASAGTHNRGGNTDVGQFSPTHIRVWREAGWTIQHRTRAQGFSMDHGHGWPFGCPHLSPAGRAQNAQWKNRRNGLVSRGPVEGPWPTVGWKTGKKRLERKIVALKDEIARETAERVLAGIRAGASPEDMWSWVGVPSPADRKPWSPGHLLDWIGRTVRQSATKAQLDAVMKQLAAIQAKLDEEPKP